MPNWVLNIVIFSGNADTIRKIQQETKSKELDFDFEEIVPMPKELDVTESGSTSLAIECAMTDSTVEEDFIRAKYKLSKEDFKESARNGLQYISNKIKYGFRSWYSWRREYWGTKWNANKPSWIDDKTLRFKTAWSTPEPIFVELSKQYPDISFEVDYADEDLGYNCGQLFYKKGKLMMVNGFDDPEKARTFAESVWEQEYDTQEWGDIHGVV